MKRSKSVSERLRRHDLSPSSGARHSSLGPRIDRCSKSEAKPHDWEDAIDLIRKSSVLEIPRRAVDSGSRPGPSVVADQRALPPRPVTCEHGNVTVDNDVHDAPPVAVALERSHATQDAELVIPSTPAPPSNDSNTASPPEHPAQRPPRCDAPRPFLISEKRTTPKGFKQLQRKSDTKTLDNRGIYFLGDGFSDYEAIPTGLVHVGGKRKFSHPAVVALGQLELTQTTSAEPEKKKQKRKRFMRTRKRDRENDNPFDFADVQLTPRLVNRSSKTSKEREMPPQLAGRPPSPSLGAFDDTDQGPASRVPRQEVAVRLASDTPGNLEPSSAENGPSSGPATVEQKTPATMLSCEGETVCSGMQLSVEAWETYEVSQTPAVADTQATLVSSKR